MVTKHSVKERKVVVHYFDLSEERMLTWVTLKEVKKRIVLTADIILMIKKLLLIILVWCVLHTKYRKSECRAAL